MEFSAVTKFWLEEVRRTRRESTFRNYTGTVRMFLRWRPEAAQRELSRQDLIEFRNWRADSRSVRSANRDLKALRACLRWAELGDLHPPVQCRRLLLPEPPTADPTLTSAEIRRVMRAAAFDLPVLVILRVCHATGLRLDEALSLVWADVDAARGTLQVSHKPGTFEAKTPKGYRRVHAPALVKWLDEYRRTLRYGRPTDPVCQRDAARGAPWSPKSSRVHVRLRRAYERAGVKGKRPTHSLRHTLATDLAEAGVPVAVAQRILGHATPSVTLGIYTHVRDTGVEAAGRSLEEFRKSRR